MENIRTYNGTEETDTFSAGDTVTIRSKVSDPLGAQDIAGAQIYIVGPSGNVAVNWDNMSVSSTDSSSPPAWNSYIYNYSLPSDAQVGTYQIKVKGIESNGVVNYLDSQFFIPCGVSVEPNHTTNATAPSTVYFNHTITNTGRGADIFDITAISENGYNVTLYASDGTLMGYDSNGDGVWDYVNSDYDRDGDGKPDTGVLLPGRSFDFSIGVSIPQNASAWENVTIYANSFLGDCHASATDTIHVPEFGNPVIPIAFVIIVGTAFIRRKKLMK